MPHKSAQLFLGRELTIHYHEYKYFVGNHSSTDGGRQAEHEGTIVTAFFQGHQSKLWAWEDDPDIRKHYKLFDF